MTWADSAVVLTDFVPEAIHNQVAIKLLVSGFLTGHKCYVYLFLHQILYLYLISPMQAVRHFNILLTEACVMHEAGSIHFIWSTYYYFSFGY